MPESEVDAVLLLSFGGPEAIEDVAPFLQRVTRGREIPPERLAEVEQQYLAFGGVSPINEQTRELRSALEAELERLAPERALRVYWGNRNWDPLLADTMRQMRADGVKRAAVVVTSGYSSYSGCRQYRENLYDAVIDVEADGEGPATELIKIRRWCDHPAFIEVMADNVVAAVRQFWTDPVLAGERPYLVFTTHSVPVSQEENSGPPDDERISYRRQHLFVAGQVAMAASRTLFEAGEVSEPLLWSLVFQSRSGPPSVPWLEPDVSDFLIELAGRPLVPGAVLVPIGFISDHMEVKWDLDTLAMGTAADQGIACVRAATVGTDPRFVAALASMVWERIDSVPFADRSALGPWGPAPDRCPVGCCASRDGRPALCGDDSPR